MSGVGVGLTARYIGTFPIMTSHVTSLGSRVTSERSLVKVMREEGGGGKGWREDGGEEGHTCW